MFQKFLSNSNRILSLSNVVNPGMLLSPKRLITYKRRRRGVVAITAVNTPDCNYAYDVTLWKQCTTERERQHIAAHSASSQSQPVVDDAIRFVSERSNNNKKSVIQPEDKEELISNQVY